MFSTSSPRQSRARGYAAVSHVSSSVSAGQTDGKPVGNFACSADDHFRAALQEDADRAGGVKRLAAQTGTCWSTMREWLARFSEHLPTISWLARNRHRTPALCAAVGSMCDGTLYDRNIARTAIRECGEALVAISEDIAPDGILDDPRTEREAEEAIVVLRAVLVRTREAHAGQAYLPFGTEVGRA